MKRNLYLKFIVMALALIGSFTLGDDKSILDYYPLNDGDYWEYRYVIRTDSFGTGFSYSTLDTLNYSLTVVGDTTLSNNKIYKKIVKKNLNDITISNQFKFERVDTESYNVYRFYISLDREILIDSLDAKIGDCYRAQRFFYEEDYPTNGKYETFYSSTSLDTLYGFITERVFLNLSPFYNNGSWNNYTIVKDLGYFSYNWGDPMPYKSSKSYQKWRAGYEILTYADVDGIVVGEALADIDESLNLVEDYSLEQNHPNPFNPTTTIKYNIEQLDFKDADFFVYNCKGEVVYNKQLKRENYQFLFDGSYLNSGVYYYTIAVDGVQLKTRSMVLIK